MNKLFGVYSVNADNNRVAILQQVDTPKSVKIAEFLQPDEESKESMLLDTNKENQVLKLVLIKHNILADPTAMTNNILSGSPSEDSSTTTRDLSIDMDISVLLQPIKLIYRPVEIERLLNFFYVEDLRPEMRKKAQSLKKSLT